MIYFTADTHYGHEKMIEICKRPFKNSLDMTKGLISNWNSIVNVSDLVIVVGDFFWGRKNYHEMTRILSTLKGSKILVLGNHDEFKAFTYVNAGFDSVHTSYTLSYGGTNIYFNHDPAVSCLVNENEFLICGHIHTLFKKIGNTVNVGVDVWDFYPVSIEDALKF